MAKRELARQGAPAGIGVTTLLHQAYLDMAARDGAAFPDRARFMGYAARVMRGLIIDYARSKMTQKRGGQFEITTLTSGVAESAVDGQELSRIGALLDELVKTEPPLAEIVDLRFFCGFSFREAAAVLGVTERTAQRRWEKARIYLHRRLRSDRVL
jgi:RNA polymerase sigma factor (TIGR02999 family)